MAEVFQDHKRDLWIMMFSILYKMNSTYLKHSQGRPGRGGLEAAVGSWKSRMSTAQDTDNEITQFSLAL